MSAVEGLTPALIAEYDRSGPRYTSYPPVPVWTGPFGEEQYRAALADVAGRRQPISLYLHLPFCARRCFYCGCNAVVTRRSERVDGYLDRVERELELLLETLGRRHPVNQIHWGGGTPNFLNPAQTTRLYRMLEAGFEISPDAERSVELDPRLVTPGQLPLLRQLGFSRVSLGVQDIDPEVQFAIGRTQPLALVAGVVEEIRALKFASLNFDLIYGLPLQTPGRFRAMLAAVLDQAPDRIAAFGYAHVPQLRPHQKAINQSDLPVGYERFKLFEGVVAELTAAGYQWIGLDHFARPDDELAIAAQARRLHRNFMGYTVQPSSDLLGIGTSAIGDLAGRFVQLDPSLSGYQKSIDAGRLPVVKGHILSPDDQARRSAIMHLMCNLELPFDFELTGGGKLGEVLGPELSRFTPHAALGLVEQEPDRLRVTRLGRFFLRNLCLELDAYLTHGLQQATYSRTI